MDPVKMLQPIRDRGANEPLPTRSPLTDPGPGRLSGGQLPRQRAVPQGSGPMNLPFAADGSLSFFDLISGVFDEHGVWHYKPIRRGIFGSGHRSVDIGTYEYNEGDTVYEEGGIRYILGPEEAALNGNFVGLDRWVHLRDSVPRDFMGVMLCEMCHELDLNTLVSELHEPVDGCDLCRILPRSPEVGGCRLVEARGHIRVCFPPGSPGFNDEDGEAHGEVHPGFPAYFESGHPSHFRYMRRWLRLCDDGECGHDSGCAPPSGQFRPTRLLRVSPKPRAPGEKDVIPIMTTDPAEEYTYIALSHCWGSQHSGIPPWCTTRANLASRAAETGGAGAGIAMDELPANFRDAVTTTRALGQEYLWIDSLCILQGDEADWKSEAAKMADVFRGAYCVVAASSAADSTRGFLRREVVPTTASGGDQLDYLQVNSSSHGPVCVTTALDDFAGDVEGAVLNSRAWVFQERALARRTLHFTGRQVYFECGGGVRCETGTYMRNEGKPSLFSDPSFPDSLRPRADVAKVELFSQFFETYSRLGITQATDRPIAILSLAQELAKTLDTKLNHGVFESFLHRGLLWHRSQEGALPRIDFGFKSSTPPPSWSWMAHHGGVAFAKIDDYFEWDARVAFSADNVLCAPVNRLRLGDFKLEPEDGLSTGVLVRNEEGEQKGTLWFDDARKEFATAAAAVQHVVVMGRQVPPAGVDLGQRRRVYVLLVDRIGDEIVERVGMGIVDNIVLEPEATSEDSETRSKIV